MDATRRRRTRDQVRLRWYGCCRCNRFARHLCFLPGNEKELSSALLLKLPPGDPPEPGPLNGWVPHWPQHRQRL